MQLGTLITNEEKIMSAKSFLFSSWQQEPSFYSYSVHYREDSF